MLLQLIVERPQVLETIVRNTPPWVWGLLAGLLWLGLSQLRDRVVGILRVTLLPAAMTGFSLWGTVSAFGNSPQFGYVLLAWLATTAATLAWVASGTASARYDSASRSFALPGSWVPLALIMAIFLTKYVVGVEMSMQPHLARDSEFTLIVGAVYGAFSGIFIGRAVRLWRLALRPPAPATAIPGLNY